MPSQHEKIKILKASSKQKSLSQKKKKKTKKIMFLVGSVGSVESHTILRSYTILRTILPFLRS